MIIKVRINKDKMYKLCDWSSLNFNANPVLKLQTDDLKDVKEAFTKISFIEVFQAGEVVMETTLYDTYSNISFSGKVYVPHENIFADCLEVTLQKSSLAEQVQKIQEKLDNVVDIESMTVDEYKEYVLKNISEKCQEDIYAGDYVDIDGENQYFSYDLYDQINLKTLSDLVTMYPVITQVPYHASNGGVCEMYSAADIRKVYITLMLRSLRILTYTNQLSCWVRTLNSKEELQDVTYGMDLVEPYATNMGEIVSATTYTLLSAIGETDEETAD